MITGVDRRKLRHRDIGQLGVVNKDQPTDCSEIRCHKGLHGVAIEPKVFCNIGQRRKGNRAAITECHVLSCLKHGKRCHEARYEAIVGLNVKGVFDAGHLQTDVLQRLIVIDVESRYFLQVVDSLE